MKQKSGQPKAPAEESSREINQQAVDAAIQKWRTSPAHQGKGGTRFFGLALDLRSAGMQHYGIEIILRSEAA